MKLRIFKTKLFIWILLTTCVLPVNVANASMYRCLRDFFRNESTGPKNVAARTARAQQTPGLYSKINPSQTWVDGIEIHDQVTQANGATLVTTYPARKQPSEVSSKDENVAQSSLTIDRRGRKRFSMNLINLRGIHSDAEALPSTIQLNDSSGPQTTTRLSNYLFLHQMKTLGITEGSLASARVDDIQNIGAIFEYEALKKNWLSTHRDKKISTGTYNELVAQLKLLTVFEKVLVDSGHDVTGVSIDTKNAKKVKIRDLKNRICIRSAVRCAEFNTAFQRSGMQDFESITIGFSIDLQLAPRR